MNNKGVSPVVGVVILVGITVVGGVTAAEVTLNLSDNLTGQEPDIRTEYIQDVNVSQSDQSTNKAIYDISMRLGPISNAEFVAVKTRTDRSVEYQPDLLQDNYPEEHNTSPDSAEKLEFIDNGQLMFNDGDRLKITNLEPGDEIVVYAVSENGKSTVASTYIVPDAVPEGVNLNLPQHTLTIESVDSTGSLVASEYRIDGGNIQSFSGRTSEVLDAGDYNVKVTRQSDGSSGRKTVNLDEDKTVVFSFGGSENYNVQITNSNSPVTSGNSVELDAIIENTGSNSGTQTVTLDAGSLGSDSSSVYLDSGDSKTERFTIPTNSGDAGSYTGTLSSDDDSASQTIQVNAPSPSSPPYFDVQIDSTNSPVVEGDTVNVEAQIENTGSTDGSQTVTLDAGSLGSDSSSISLDSGDSTRETYTFSTSSGDAGSYTGTLSSDDDSASQTIQVNGPSPASFDVQITNINDPIKAGDPLVIDAQIENTGGSSDTKSVSFDAGIIGSNSKSVSLSSGESTSETFTFSTSSGDAGSYTGTLSSDGNTDTQTFQINSVNPYFKVDISSITDPVDAGDDIEVTANIENTGNAEDTQSIDFSASGLGSTSTSVNLNDGVSTTVDLRLPTTSSDGGSYTGTVSSDDDTDNKQFTVQGEPQFKISIDEGSSDSIVYGGNDIKIVAEITNQGSSGTRVVDLNVGSLGSDQKTISLSSGDSVVRTFTVPTEGRTGVDPGDVGPTTYSAIVSSNSDSDSVDAGVFLKDFSLTGDVVKPDNNNVKNKDDIIKLYSGNFGTDSPVATASIGGAGVYQVDVESGTNLVIEGDYTANDGTSYYAIFSVNCNNNQGCVRLNGKVWAYSPTVNQDIVVESE